MNEKESDKFMGILVEHRSEFLGLSTDDAQWAIQNPKEAIVMYVEVIKSRNKSSAQLLDFLGTIEVLVTTKKFIARDHFIVDKSDEAKVKISYLGDTFRKEFLDKTEEPFVGSTLQYMKLRKSSVDTPIIAEIGGEEKAETTLTEMFACIAEQVNGEEGALVVNGWANVFYIRNTHSVLRAVRCCWYGDGWDVRARSADSPFGWGDGFRFFFRNLVA